MKDKPIALIPAYKPEASVVETARGLLRSASFKAIVCVDDGSGKSYNSLFRELESLGVTVLRHAYNLGKGAALKTGINYVGVHFPQSVGVVTLDADGQHLPDDCVAVAHSLMNHHESLIMGSRTFNDADIPFRSRFGNILTRKILRLFTGIQLTDTQSGLRGIPSSFFKNLLQLKTTGYDFELDMLIEARSRGIPFVQVPVTTIYIDQNSSSHFNPLWDSLKIYMVFFRFNISSFFTLIIDYIVFALVFVLSSKVALSIIVARIVAGFFNYTVNRSFVFKSKNSIYASSILYSLTVIVLGVAAYGLITFLVAYLDCNVYLAKFLSELLLYVVSFSMQKNIVFVSKTNNNELVTDWNSYYAKKSIFSNMSSYIAFRGFKKKVDLFTQHITSIVELGGGNSIFYEAMIKNFPDVSLYLVDQCESTPEFMRKINNNDRVHTVQANILGDEGLEHLTDSADCVVSFGLIEHFDSKNTAEMIAKHFLFAKPGAIIYISFPTPTFLYKQTRNILECLGKWVFHDERPLEFSEVLQTAEKHGSLLYKGISYRLGLTQGIVILRKRDTSKKIRS